MKPIEQAFLSSILESPDDDAPRLIYADWLEENGQAERAEFIRVQCQLFGFPSPNHAPDALRRRERELLDISATSEETPERSRHVWAEGVYRVAHKYVFHRGFVEEVTLPLSAWLQHGPALVKAAPLRMVRLSDYQPMYNEVWGWAYVPGRAELGAGNWWRRFRDVLLKTFSTEAAALAAMSRCCLLYACVQTVPVG